MTRVSNALRNEVRQRANQRCEYCRLPERESPYPFHIEHIIAIQHEGASQTENLAWACLQCNRAKGPNIASNDLQTGKLTPLYNPRQQSWESTFEVIDGEIQGRTAVGRVTVRLLKFNTPQRVELRKELIAAGQW